MSKVRLEYIWLDGSETPQLRSKTKVLDAQDFYAWNLPVWGFDGSSTGQADGSKSDVELRPVRLFKDPIRGTGSYLVMCETFNSDGTPALNNHRAKLRETLATHKTLEGWFGFEQEYFLIDPKTDFPLGWVQDRYGDYDLPKPQGPFYCAVGGDVISGRQIVEEHLEACINAESGNTGINAEVALGQWEFQCFAKDALEAADMLWAARWLLNRIAESHGVSVDLTPKPFSGDVNGSGLHTNFSTKEMRRGGSGDLLNGMYFITVACEAIGLKIPEHLAVYGIGNEERLTGAHETCSITEFRFGVSDRGASIRIPLQVSQEGCGYLEDRRPAANADPYQVADVLLDTVGTVFQSIITTQETDVKEV